MFIIMHKEMLMKTLMPNLFSLSCVCNSRFQVHSPGRRLVLTAQLDVARGEEVTVRYMPALMGASRRRYRMHSNWHFNCTCARCADPTELGTHVGATRCADCAGHSSGVGAAEKAALLEYMRSSLEDKLKLKRKEGAPPPPPKKCSGLLEELAKADQGNSGSLGIMLPK